MINNCTKFIVLLLITLLSLNNKAKASHIIGGDITYKCLGNNRFGFTFTLYHDCLGQAQAIIDDSESYYSIFNANTGAPVLAGQSMGIYVDQQNIPTGFANECINNAPNTCMSKMVFEFEVTLPPTNDGYVFVYQRCCRNQTLNNIYAPGTTGATFTTYIPPFTNGQCINNSAVFNNAPPQIICADNPFFFDFSATDIDGDSLSYELCNSYIGGGNNQGEIMPGSPGNIPNNAPPHTPVS